MAHLLLPNSYCPKLFVPKQSGASQETLRLYPAQRRLARLCRVGLKGVLRSGLPWCWPTGSPPPVAWGRVSWLPEAVRAELNVVPAEVGVLAGNPQAEGQRFLYLAFDDRARPLYIAKIGFNSAARTKIRAEAEFLLQNGSAARGVPQPLGTLADGETSGVILPYVRGRTPRRRGAAPMIGAILAQWVPDGEAMALADIPAWSRLNDEHGHRHVDGQRVRPVIMHGDFAPWNVIVDRDREWNVIDWERGAYPGVPGWDWFHYVVQVECLVKRSRPRKVWRRLQKTIAHPTFQAYAEQTRIKGIEPMILRGYCHHALELLKENSGGKDRERTERVLRGLLAV